MKTGRASAIGGLLETAFDLDIRLANLLGKARDSGLFLEAFPRLPMKPTVKLEYALRALVCLAKKAGDGSVMTIDEVANAEEIPAKFLAQIMAELRRGGLVSSRRGKEGGYFLAKRPEEVSLHEVIALMQGDMLGQDMESTGTSGSAVSSAWKSQREDFEKRLSSYTLRDVLSGDNREMYYI